MSALLDRICVDPQLCHGQPCIKGTRIMVWLILNYLANGDSVEDILALHTLVLPGKTSGHVWLMLQRLRMRGWSSWR
jgi:hypothetical protein